MKNSSILVKKASGDHQLFVIEKLKHSLQNAGAKDETISKIADYIENWIYDGVSTKKIYSKAFSILRHEKTNSALRYKLKQAIMELGPTGFPFENFIGQIFEKQGFSVKTGIVVDGKCVTHEMDVIATKNLEQHLVECKYSKDQGKHVSIQVPLYVRSRVNDIINKRQELSEFQKFSFTGWVVTNTRFSSDSINYSKCSALKLLAWDYPSKNGLKEIIENLKIYPITILNRLTKKEKQFLLENEIVSCNQLLQAPEVLKKLELTDNKERAIMNEIKNICRKSD